jgi:short-subunit dehydrogenase involved in D-alanine esterification of teichoic acids
VQVDPSLAPDIVWQKLVDSVTSRYSSLEMVDAASGYMRSVYVIKKFPHSEGTRLVRTRFICSISSKTPLVYKMKIESETIIVKTEVGLARLSDPQQQDWDAYPRIFKEDQQLIDEITGRLSVK